MVDGRVYIREPRYSLPLACFTKDYMCIRAPIIHLSTFNIFADFFWKGDYHRAFLQDKLEPIREQLSATAHVIPYKDIN